MLDETLADCKHVVGIDKRHFHIDLGEFGLTVCAEVLVAEATRDLEVPVKSRNHRKLLIKLGRLRKRVERALVHTRGHEVVASSLGGGLDENESFYFDKALIAEVVADRLCNLCAEDNVVLKHGTAEVQISVSKSQLLVRLAIVGDIEGGSFAFAEHAHGRRENFDITGRYIGVLARALADDTRRGNDVLGL